MTTHDRRGLPKWAREELERLERSVEHWRAKANVGPDESDTFAATAYGEHAKPLGRRTVIVFYPEGAEDRRRFDVVLQDDGRLRVSVQGNPTLGLCVMPHASNVAYIGADRP